jgi:hypothetical protein
VPKGRLGGKKKTGEDKACTGIEMGGPERFTEAATPPAMVPAMGDHDRWRLAAELIVFVETLELPLGELVGQQGHGFDHQPDGQDDQIQNRQHFASPRSTQLPGLTTLLCRSAPNSIIQKVDSS